MRIRTPWIFGIGAGVYDAITAQETWRRDCRDMAAALRGPDVLDLGTGPGVSAIEMARAVPSRRVTGVDRSAAMLRRARRHVDAAGVRLALVRADVHRLPFADGTYDGATGHSVLYLLDDPEDALREVHRVVRPGGGVAFLEPNGRPSGPRAGAVGRAWRDGLRHGASMLLWSIFSALHGRYTAQRLADQLVRCGFRNVRITPSLDGLGLRAIAERP